MVCSCQFRFFVDILALSLGSHEDAVLSDRGLNNLV